MTIKSHQRKRDFKAGDRVYLSRHFNNYMETPKTSGFVHEIRRGTVKKVFIKEEVTGRAKRTWLTILWDGLKSPSDHASQRIRFESELQ